MAHPGRDFEGTADGVITIASGKQSIATILTGDCSGLSLLGSKVTGHRVGSLTLHYDRNITLIMRYPLDQKRRTRERILGAAAALFRRHGYSATGVDAVMASADLTAGAFYSHFGSKQVLLTKALDTAFRQSRRDWQNQLKGLRGGPWVRKFAAFYLSEGHRDAADLGCPMPALTPEISRSGEASRAVFEQHLRDLVDTVAQHVDSTAPDRGHAISAIALSVGGLMLARAVKDRGFSDEILSACRGAVVEGCHAEEKQ
jgi:TetR/AcrR family transcriptional regulator, transcriptional repressor for nem operon